MSRLSNAESSLWKPIVAFVHIPRTGGGSMTSAISRAYGRTKSAGNVQRGPEKTRAALERIGAAAGEWSGRAVADHVPYGLYARYLPADTRYLTILRDPVERVLSHYYFHAQQSPTKVRTIWRRDLEAKGEDPAGVGEEDDISLEAGLARGITIYNNFATRFIWGGESLEGELPPDALERAKENLARFAFVGVTERLDESMILLSAILGAPLSGYHLRHVREGRPKANNVPAGLIRLIEEHNALDIELYRLGRERFDAEAAAAGDVNAQLEELMRQRTEVTEVAEAQRVERKTASRARRRAEKAERGQAAKAARRGRQRGGVPDDERGADDLREELAALKHRMLAIEAVLRTRGEEPEVAAAQPKARDASRRALEAPWRGKGRRPAPDAGSEETEKPPAAKSGKGGGPERTRKAGKQPAGAGSAHGGKKPKKPPRSTQPESTPADQTGGNEPDPQSAAGAA